MCWCLSLYRAADVQDRKTSEGMFLPDLNSTVEFLGHPVADLTTGYELTTNLDERHVQPAQSDLASKYAHRLNLRSHANIKSIQVVVIQTVIRT
jgi:hypothetical protein